VTDYDFVIVGGGSAGATLAARLTEAPSRRVALLEAGPDWRSADAPAHLRWPNPGPIIQDENWLWPQLKARRTAAQQPSLFWRGRGMGGSSAMNGQIAIRPPLEDFDAWPAGWRPDDVLRYFTKLEDDQDFPEANFHGRGGPTPVRRAPKADWGPMDLALAEAGQILGYGWAADHNAPGATGVSPYAINNRAGKRVSVNDAYLEPARGRPNLTIIGDALVDRVLFDGRRAAGVRVRLGGAWVELKARTTILSAGAVHSPAILVRSGIGPAGHLEALGIARRATLPVGDNLQDHPAIAVAMPLKPAVRVADIAFRHTNCCLRYSSGHPGTSANDMIVIAFNLMMRDRAVGRLAVSVFQSFSSGTLRLASPDPAEDPVIEENMLSDPRDLARMRDGVARLKALIEQPAFRDRVDGPPRLAKTGIALDPLPGDDALLAEAGDAQHITSTCTMGGVVDSDCRVLGFDQLRVIDASVMPLTVRANTNLTTIMIAEMMADRLKAG